MADAMQLDLVAADRIVWSGEAQFVSTRTVEGEVGIMAHHIPMLAVLAPGTVEVRTDKDERWIAAVDGGFISVANNRVSILSGHVEMADEIDLQQARQDLERAQQADELHDDSERVVKDAQNAVLAAQARVVAAEKTSS